MSSVPPTLPDRSRSPSPTSFGIGHIELITIHVPKNMEELISNACQKILDAQQKLEKATGIKRTKLIDDVAMALVQLERIANLDDSTKSRMDSLLCAAYRALDIFKEKIEEAPYLVGCIKTHQTVMEAQCMGIGSELSLMFSLVEVGQKIGKQGDVENFVLDVAKDGKSFTTIDPKKATDENQGGVYKLVPKLVKALDAPHVVKHFTLVQFLYMKMALANFLVNYILLQSKELDLLEHIFEDLKVVHSKLNRILANREPEEFKTIKPSVLQSFMLIKANLVSKLYGERFWDDPNTLDALEEYANFMDSCCQFINNPNFLDIQGLAFLTKDETAGLALYELPDEEGTLIIFSYKKEDMLQYWNFMQSRATGLRLGGLGHAPVYKDADVLWDALQIKLKEREAVDEKEGKVKKQYTRVITGGFGLDGAAAQILAYNYAKKYPQVQTRTYMMGTAPFLDVNAAATFLRQPNHLALNCVMKGDNLMEQSFFGGMVQKKYSEENYIKLPLFNRTWFATDVTGHSKALYTEKIEEGLKRPKDLFKLHADLKNLVQILDSKKDVEFSVALCNHCNSYRNE